MQDRHQRSVRSLRSIPYTAFRLSKERYILRLNTNTLNDKLCKEYTKNELKEDLQTNDNGAVSPNVLWDAWKAVLRGKLIAFTTHKKRKNKDDYWIYSLK